MPDAPTPPPAPEEAETQPRGYFNQAQLDDIAEAEAILPPAQETTRAAALAARGITAEYVTGLETAVAAAREKIAETGQGGDASEAATLNAKGAERALITVRQAIQSAAKQKASMLAEDDDPATNFSVEGYLIGRRLNANRATLLQNAATLRGKAGDDALPGYGTPADLLVIDNAIKAYKTATATQAERDEESESDRLERDALVRKINARRNAIQHAADALWPYTAAANAPVRKLFKLPKNRPMVE